MFNEKLNLLMTVQGISNSRLAKALSVDASLVSRWRSGARIPNPGSTHIKALASYFAAQAKMGSQKSVLCEVMGLPPEKWRDESQTMAGLLHSWLSDSLRQDTRLVDRFIVNLEATATNMPAGIAPPPNATAYPGSGSSTSTTLVAEAYYGIRGKQEGVIRFLSTVLDQQRPCTLLLYSDESIDWLTGDKSFLAVFAPLFRRILARGCKVKVVHTVSRDISEMFAAIDFWLPLYLAGDIEPYYYPRYREHYFRRTLFIAPGVASLASTALASLENSSANIYCTDRRMIESLTAEFKEYLSMCRPLMRIFSAGNLDGLSDLLTEFVEQPGDCYSLSGNLSAVTLPEETLASMLERSGLGVEIKEKTLLVHRARVKAFFANLERSQHTEIVVLPSPDEIKGGHVKPDLPALLFSGADLSYTPKEYAMHLKNIINLLNLQPRFNFYVCQRGAARNVSLTAKDGVGVVVATTDPQRALFAFNQPNMTNSFYCYLEDFARKLPPKERSRQAAVETLATLSGIFNHA